MKRHTSRDSKDLAFSFFKTKDSSHNLNKQYIVSLILTGTLVVFSALLILLVATSIAYNTPNVLPRILAGLFCLTSLLICIYLLKRGYFRAVAWILLSFYEIIAIIIIINWGVNAPVGVLMLGFVIFLSGVMLGSKYIIPVSLGVGGILLLVYLVDFFSPYNANHVALSIAPNLGDVITYLTIFGVFTLIAWLSGRQMERSLTRALQAEAELEEEKASLSSKLTEQTQTLRKTQQEEILQLYQFAELGQLTTVVLHDLANNLSILSLDIDDLDKKYKASDAIRRTKESISYLEGMVSKARKQISKTNQLQRFDAPRILRQTSRDLSLKANKSGISIKLPDQKRSFPVMGDPTRLTHVFTILINNAIDASSQSQSLKQIIIRSKQDKDNLYISVIDYGTGIPDAMKEKLFEPLQSKKQNGLGIGLFVAHQITEKHFKGNLYLNRDNQATEFIVRLPRAV